MTATVEMPRLISTRDVLALIPISRARWQTYYRQHRTLREARRRVGGKHLWDARAVARHINQEMAR